ncbi:MAG: hypothetical protein ACTTGJ_00255 [Clostridium sp.]
MLSNNVLKYKLKSNNGITMILLVLTIIILTIIAGVVINLSTNNNELLNSTISQKQKYNNKQIEDIFLDIYHRKYDIVMSNAKADEEIEEKIFQLVKKEFEEKMAKEKLKYTVEKIDKKYIIKDEKKQTIYEYDVELM